MAGNVETILDQPTSAQRSEKGSNKSQSRVGIALADIGASIVHADVWWTLALHDVRARYRRTVLGPFWIVLSTAIGLIGMAAVWSALFGMSFAETFPYMSAGFLLWTFIQSLVLESCSVFASAHATAIQRNLSLPKSFHVLRMVARSGLLFLHNVVTFVVAAILFVTPTPWMWMAIPGFLALLLNGVWLGLLLGSLGVRFRDIEPLVGSVMTVLFFITPIVWHEDMLGERAYYAHINPFSHFIAIVRDPLLGLQPPLHSWIIVGVITVLGFVFCLPVFAKARGRVVFWI